MGITDNDSGSSYDGAVGIQARLVALEDLARPKAQPTTISLSQQGAADPQADADLNAPADQQADADLPAAGSACTHADASASSVQMPHLDWVWPLVVVAGQRAELVLGGRGLDKEGVQVFARSCSRFLSTAVTCAGAGNAVQSGTGAVQHPSCVITEVDGCDPAGATASGTHATAATAFTVAVSVDGLGAPGLMEVDCQFGEALTESKQVRGGIERNLVFGVHTPGVVFALCLFLGQ